MSKSFSLKQAAMADEIQALIAERQVKCRLIAYQGIAYLARHAEERGIGVVPIPMLRALDTAVLCGDERSTKELCKDIWRWAGLPTEKIVDKKSLSV